MQNTNGPNEGGTVGQGDHGAGLWGITRRKSSTKKKKGGSPSYASEIDPTKNYASKRWRLIDQGKEI